MQCSIYRSRRKDGCYLYCAVKDDFAAVPRPLLETLGELTHAMDLELTPQRRLAREDVLAVMQALEEKGWFLQLAQQEDWAAEWRPATTPVWGHQV